MSNGSSDGFSTYACTADIAQANSLLPIADLEMLDDLAGAGILGDIDRAAAAGGLAGATTYATTGSAVNAGIVGGAAAVGSFGFSSSGSGGGGFGGRVICTHFYKKGKIDRETWRADLEFTARHLSETTVRGYQYWAIPYVKLMRRSRVAERVMYPIAIHRANEIAYQLGLRKRGSLRGKAVRVIMEPLCFILGTVVRQKDWSHLWESHAPELMGQAPNNGV